MSLTSTVISNLSLTQEESNEKHSIITQSIIVGFYSIIFLVGIVGNGLVVYVVCRNKAMQSVTNVFITNLALSDILMCLLAVPFTPLSFFSDSWMFGKVLCHLVPFSLGVSVYVSTLTSLAIAIDRYFVIVHPFKPRMKLGVCILLIAVVWIVAVSISLPLAIYVKYNSTPIKTTCTELWPIPMLKRFFDLASLVLQYIIPFTVITYSYSKVWYILSKRTRPGKTKEKEQIELKRKKRTNRMLVAMVIIFAGCWMPLNIVHQIMEFKKDFTQNPHFSSVFFVAHVIAMSSTIYNPFLYAWLNDNFRKEFRLVIPCLFKIIKWCRTRRCKSSSSSSNDIEHHNEDEDDYVKDPSKVISHAFSMTNRTSLGIAHFDNITNHSRLSNFSQLIHDDNKFKESKTSLNIVVMPSDVQYVKKSNTEDNLIQYKNRASGEFHVPKENDMKRAEEVEALLNNNNNDNNAYSGIKSDIIYHIDEMIPCDYQTVSTSNNLKGINSETQ